MKRGAIAAFLIGLSLMAVSLTPSERRALGNQARIQLARVCAAEGDILGWGKALMPERFRLPFCNELHQHLVDSRNVEMESTEAPRGHAKTTVGCFLIPLYAGLVEDNFNHFLNVQATEDKALSINRSIKMELEQNQLLKALYGNQIGERWTDAQFVLKNGKVYSAAGTGSATVRGLIYRDKRPDWVAVDDFYSTDDDVRNPKLTQGKNDWLWSTLYPAMAQDKRNSFHFRGTAVNREDQFERFRKEASGTVVSRTFKAITDWGEKTTLWPQLRTFEQLLAMKERMGSLIFSREFQNERVDDSSSIVKREWLHPSDGTASWEYDPSSLVFGEWLSYVSGVVTLDPSIGKKDTSDKSGYAFIIKAQPSDGSLPRYYIESLVNGHHSFQERIDTMKRLTSNRPRERPATGARVETIGGFKDIGDKIAASVAVPCALIDHVANKLVNLEKHSAIFENKRIFLNRDIAPSLKDELVHQLTSNTPRNDDLRDAVLLGLEGDAAGWGAWV